VKQRVRAAGGAVTRRRNGALEVLLVHRPRYDDWTLPKGKLLPGEREEEGALREVEDETGLTCELGPELVTTEYVDSRGHAKTVRYWAMHPLSGQFRPHDEIDEVRWLPLDRARALLSYERDFAVLDALAAAV
jgi:8-oxo-dGTP pyrophosphatase MutT (NUDIX family)